MAKIYLRPEPYDPDAEDADGDGIVQERTAWERPGGTHLVDKFGQAIERGRSLTERPEGIQVVDRAGKPVKYTPTYAGEMAAGSIGAGKGPSSPLSDHGHASLAERGLPTIRSLSMPRPAVASAAVPAKNVPPKSESEVPLKSGSSIREKNKQILDAIKSTGSEFGHTDQAFIDKLEETPFMFKGLHQLKTKEQITAQRDAVLKQTLSVMRDSLLGKTTENDPMGWKAGLAAKVQRAHPDVQKFILESSDEEVIQKLQDLTGQFHEGLRGEVFVQMPPDGRLEKFLSDGRYKTTHEARSDHSPSDLRMAYEASLGISPEAPASVRPASGYVVHQDWVQDAENPYGHMDVDAAGRVEIYGGVRLKLKSEVSERTRFGRGDSLRGSLSPTGFDDKDPDTIMNAHLFGRNEESDKTSQMLLNFLEADRIGSFERVHNPLGFDPTYGDYRNNDYFEALIPGAFSVDEVDEMKMKSYDFIRFSLTGRDMRAEEKQLLPTERLRDLGFTEAEINFLYAQMARDGRSYAGSAAVQQLVEYRAMKEAKDRIEKLGPKVVLTNDKGVDLFDPKSYSGGKPGDDVEKILQKRVDDKILEAVRMEMEAERRRATREFDPDLVM